MKNPGVGIVILLILLGVFLILAGRCFYLQYYGSDYYHGCALRQLQARVFQAGRRGVILDRCGRVLAASNERDNVFAEPRAIKDPKLTARELGVILDMPAHEICRIITDSKNPGYAKIKADIDTRRCDSVGAAGITGIGIEREYQRFYPMYRLASHVVGFTSRGGSDDRGLGGIELRYDEELSGSAGTKIFLADALRRPITEIRPPLLRFAKQNGGGETRDSVDGVGVILTLDATIQQIARTELLEQYESYEAESAVAIVMEPDSGAVLAMVSLPDFDPQNIGAADANVLRNRALTDPFEPGSVLKPIIAAIALDAGVVSVNETIFCEDGDYRGKGFGRIGEYGDHEFGDLTVREILVQSSNIGMAKIGQRIGAKRLYRGLELFGFGRKTGIDLPGEDSGLLWPVDKWTGYSVTRIPFGQEIAVTAMQIVRAFCVLANGGSHIAPHIVKAVVDNQGNIIEITAPPVPVRPGRIVRPAVARWIVNKALIGVVNEGTGKKAALKKWQVFGKTGTANIARSDGKGYSQQDYIATFVGAASPRPRAFCESRSGGKAGRRAPAEKPEVVVLVSIYKPNKKLGKGYTGGTVAAPVVAAILEKTLVYLEQTGR